MKKTRNTTALVKDLELQIDFLISYAPQGLHWKQEYYFRKQLIDETLLNESTPKEIRQKIYKIQESLYNLQNKIKNDQEYLNYQEPEDTERNDIIIHDWRDKNKSNYKELPDELKNKRDWRKHDPYLL